MRLIESGFYFTGFLGQEILTRQQQEGWSAKVIERNLKYMRKFAETYPDEQIVQQAAAQIPWFHNCVLLDKVKDSTEREWDLCQTIERGWSRKILVHQIESQLYHRQGKAITNFDPTLPPVPSDLAQRSSSFSGGSLLKKHE